MAGPEDPLFQHSGLDRASLAVINDLADLPDRGPLLRALDEQFGEWCRDAGATPRLRTIVVPPCDTSGMLTI
jgi:hypothetical protein